MKKSLVFACAALLFTLSACGGTGRATALAKPAEATAFFHREAEEEDFQNVLVGALAFSSAFSEAAYGLFPGDGNFTVSPASVYSALAATAVCTAGETKAELLTSLGVSEEELAAGYGAYYRSLTRRIAETERGNGKCTIANAVWVNEDTHVREECLKKLSENIYCHAYSADFEGDNKAANEALRSFVKREAGGLIDKDLKLGEETSFAVVSVLHVKDVWNMFGEEIAVTAPVPFTAADGSTKSVALLQSYYEPGRAAETVCAAYFYAQTYHGYRLKLIMPKEGHDMAEVFGAENLAAVNAATDFAADDHGRKIHYFTRCHFPAFTASFDGDVRSALIALGIGKMFSGGEADFSALTDTLSYCTGVEHAAKLTVDRRGIEGAAVTVEPMAGSPGPDGYENVYEDFILNGPFAFLLTDPYGSVLFSGVVREV